MFWDDKKTRDAQKCTCQFGLVKRVSREKTKKFTHVLSYCPDCGDFWVDTVRGWWTLKDFASANQASAFAGAKAKGFK